MTRDRYLWPDTSVGKCPHSRSQAASQAEPGQADPLFCAPKGCALPLRACWATLQIRGPAMEA